MAEPDAIETLDEAIKKLKVAYEKYFAGIDRVEPLKERDQVKKSLRRVQSETNTANNTARRFKLQSLQATLITHEAYWNRIARQIEEGTYKRDRLRAEKLKEREEAGGAAGPARASEPEAQPENQAATAKQYPAPLLELHDAYVKARREVGEHEPVEIDVFAATVQKQYTAIKARYQCDNVEFKVTVKEGRAILKAIPK